MRRLLRLCLLIAAFLGGCQAQNMLAIDACLDRGGSWAESGAVFLGSALPGGVCLGIKAK
jgi:hypothetical protein